MVVTKEGKLLTDEGDEQVDIFAERFIFRLISVLVEILINAFQVTSLKPAEAVGAWKTMADKS